MTEVSFHFNAADKLGYALRLLRKAYRASAHVVVIGPAATLDELDRNLWCFDPLEFIPHVRLRAGQARAPRLDATPLWLVDEARDAPKRQVLVNLGTSLATGFESFDRLIEIVSADDDDRQAGRQRWKHYSERGYSIVRHDAAA